MRHTFCTRLCERETNLKIIQSIIEEVIQDIGSMKRMQEKRVLKYLDLLSNQFLYQKMGFLLSEHKEKMGLSDEFFDTCKSQIGKSKRYLTKDMSGGRYVDEWKLGAICCLRVSLKNSVMNDIYCRI